ncbi:hypothetical protein [Actinoplanes cyaneus]|nr:hypothetical protein [Actinoplanes cyaneus]MCW2144618.1 hypothetical protein [Actinoplanes cyaneus]
MTDVDLAAAHLGYGTGGHDEIDAEFWRRFPILAGWHSAMEWLGSEQTEQWHAANGGFDPMGDLAPVSAQYQQLLEKYRTMVQEVVDGATQEAGEA